MMPLRLRAHTKALRGGREAGAHEGRGGNKRRNEGRRREMDLVKFPEETHRIRLGELDA